MSPSPAESSTKLNEDSIQRPVLVAISSPETPVKDTPVSSPQSPRLNVNTRKVSYALRGNDCVTTLKKAGLLPNQRVTKDGWARTIPTKPLELKEGEKAVVKTKEGPKGHVVYVEKVGEHLISRVEGGNPGGTGRIVPPSVIVGEVSL